MDEKKNEIVETVNDTEYISEKDAKSFKELFNKCLKSYKEKESSVTDEQWLEQIFKEELPEISAEEAKADAEEIITSITIYDENLKAVNDAADKGVSKESWLADKIQEASVGMAVNEYGQHLQNIDNILYQKNAELAEALRRSADGHIKMSPNLDGNIAENLIAKTTELSASLQGKNIKVEVRDVFTPNSVDVRATNLKTGKYQNYQLKFGKDAKATIELIERGNYNNQQIIVPTEQLDEIQAHFKAKGSQKTISDHIDAWGAKGKKFTKQEMKNLQLAAQEDGIMPSMDYSHYQTKELALSIGKNAGTMALQAAAVTTGITVASKMMNGESVDPEELIEVAIKTGADTSIKTVTAGVLQIAIRKGIIKFIPKGTPAGVIANIACVGIENIKILAKIASGELSVTKGLDQMGRTTASMTVGLWAMSEGTAIGTSLGVSLMWIPVIGPAMPVITGFIGGTVGYFAGSKVGEEIYNAGKRLAISAKIVAKSVWGGLKKVGKSLTKTMKSPLKVLLGF